MAKPMSAEERVLSADRARSVYDRIGRAQDTQAFYEDRAIDELIAHLDLGQARSVFEFGCGTGRFAARLLTDHLAPDATYHAIDLSPVMVSLARRRLAPFGTRVEVLPSDGGASTGRPSHQYDRFLSNFVLDLLSKDQIEAVVREAHRILRPGGLLGLSSLTAGFTPVSRAFAWCWRRLHAFRPALVGGCRPLELPAFLPESQWRIRHDARVAPFGIPLEAVVAERIGADAQ